MSCWNLAKTGAVQRFRDCAALMKVSAFFDGNPIFNLWTNSFYMSMDYFILNQESFERCSGLGTQKHHVFFAKHRHFHSCKKQIKTIHRTCLECCFLLWHLLAHRSFKKPLRQLFNSDSIAQSRWHGKLPLVACYGAMINRYLVNHGR